jgi:hypothetical protein
MAGRKLAHGRVAAFVVTSAAVLAWYIVAPHLEPQRPWVEIAIVALAVLPGTLLLVLIALPLWSRRWLIAAAVALALIAFGCTEAGWGLPANFAKLWAAVFAGWAFIRLFEELSWVALIAVIVPVVDVLSVWRGPTRSITSHHIHVYENVAIAFLAPGGPFYFGPPDILFYALFLAAAQRWNLRVGWTWVSCTGMYGVAIATAYAVHKNGIAALPFLSFGFLAPNADLLWRSIRSGRSSSAAAAP